MHSTLEIEPYLVQDFDGYPDGHGAGAGPVPEVQRWRRFERISLKICNLANVVANIFDLDGGCSDTNFAFCFLSLLVTIV